jgi:hypothetical protein
MKNVVKTMNKDDDGFLYLKNIFPGISEVTVIEGIMLDTFKIWVAVCP